MYRNRKVIWAQACNPEGVRGIPSQNRAKYMQWGTLMLAQQEELKIGELRCLHTGACLCVFIHQTWVVNWSTDPQKPVVFSTPLS